MRRLLHTAHRALAGICTVALASTLCVPPVALADVQDIAQETLSAVRRNLQSHEQQVQQASQADAVAGAGEEFVAGEVLVSFEEGTTPEQAQRVVEASPVLDAPAADMAGAVEDALHEDTALEVPVADTASVEEAVESLSRNGCVEHAQPNYLYSLDSANEPAAQGAAAPLAVAASGQGRTVLPGSEMSAQSVQVNDPQVRSGAQYHLGNARFPDAWEHVRAEGAVTVAVIDTGCKASHPDLRANVVGAANCVVNKNAGLPAHAPDSSTTDRDGHGTHVCGIISACANNALGVAGVSYNAKVMPLKVFHYIYNSQTGKARYQATSADVDAAYKHLLGKAERDVNGDGKVGTVAQEYNVRVANLSLGGSQASKDAVLTATLRKARSAGISTVCAAGNTGMVTNTYPADLNCCVSVVALDADNTLASYSDFGPGKDIAAPGTDILSTAIASDASAEGLFGSDSSGYYAKKTGTSMAAPIVSGALALVGVANPNLNAAEAEQVLYDTAKDAGPSGRDMYYGWGRLDAAAAVQRALQAKTDAAALGALQAHAKANTGKGKMVYPRKGAVYSYQGVAYKITASGKKKRTVVVAGFAKKQRKQVTIPAAMIISGMTYQITAIKPRAFKGKRKLKVVVCKASKLARVGADAFQGCSKLAWVEIRSKKLRKVGKKAFFGCKKLKTLAFFSKKLVRVGARSCARTPGTARVYIPRGKYKAYSKRLWKAGLSYRATFIYV